MDTLPGYSERATHGAPLIEVFSVSVETEDNYHHVMEIYGDITITDGEGYIFHLYKQKKNDPETVTTGQNLSLTFPEYRAISPNGIVKVEVRLKSVDQTMLVDYTCEWDYRHKNDYDKTQTQKFWGSNGFYAALNYITYRCAVIGYPLIYLFKEEGDGDSASADARQVYGRIVASRVNKHQCIGSGAITKEIVLFDESEDEPLTMECEGTYALCITLVVPAYSNVEINALLKDGITNREIARCCVTLPSRAYSSNMEFCGPVKLQIDWCHPYSQPPSRRKLKRGLETPSGGENYCSHPWVHVPSPQAPSMAMSIDWPLQGKLIEQDPMYTSVMEIFSVYVGDKISKLSGSIFVSDNYLHDNAYIIYKREEHAPEELSQDNEVASIDIVGPPTVIKYEYMIYVHLELEDDQGRPVAIGLFQWRYGSRDDWLGKRMCALVTSKHGYAAVHYTIFRAGLQATVEVLLFTTEPGQYIIYGTIVSEYGEYKCLTQYDKEFYRSKLFVKPKTNPFEYYSKSPCLKVVIPLSKSVVAVPKKSSLDLHFDLYVETPNGFVEHVNNTASFEFSPSPVSIRCKGRMFSLGLDVKWG